MKHVPLVLIDGCIHTHRACESCMNLLCKFLLCLFIVNIQVLKQSRKFLSKYLCSATQVTDPFFGFFVLSFNLKNLIS